VNRRIWIIARRDPPAEGWVLCGTTESAVAAHELVAELRTVNSYRGANSPLWLITADGTELIELRAESE
jgi:hypothetical protein